MIKLTEGGILNCLPDKETPEIVALSYSLQKAIGLVIKHADESRVYSAIEQLPEKILDVLAIEIRSLYYNEKLPIEKKRELVKNSMQWYTKAGTPSAVEELIQTVFGMGKVVEWFDYEEGPYIRGTFDIITEVAMNEYTIEQFMKSINKAKNSRSHIRKIIISRKVNCDLCYSSTLKFTRKYIIMNNSKRKIKVRQDYYCNSNTVHSSKQIIKKL